MASALYPLKFLPLYKNVIWGGNRLKDYGFDYSPLPNCGELWALSSVEGHESVVANGFLAENTLAQAMTDHGFANECENGTINQSRIWWVQAEALMGFLNAWEKTGDPRYEAAVRAQWRYTRDVLIDRRPGSEWFWYMHEDGAPGADRPIVEPWKCPYHNGRMALELIRRGQ